MRLYEISSSNQVIIVLSGTNIDFDDQFKLIISAKDMFVRMKRKSNLSTLLNGNVSVLEHDLKRFIRTSFLEPKDPDLIQRKKKARTMLRNLKIISQEIELFLTQN